MTRVPLRTIPGLALSASAVALGFMDFDNFASGAEVLDAFWEAGGNLLDTAWVYSGGYTEQLLGEWLAARGTRAEAMVVGKGAHTPFCDPASISRQLTESLDRMQTDYVDVYFMHRDNLDVPVGEFVDALDDEVRAGRIRGPFGGSNWTMGRMDAAMAYAATNGRQAPSVLSNNFSLAEMVGVIWDGCISSSTADWRQWLTRTGVTNFAWSSQSRGFFTDRAGRDKFDDEEVVRVWYSESNFARRDRAVQLGKEMGKDPIHVALAYVLAQPFPSIPIIGPHSLAELHNSLQAFDISLSDDQVAWLEGPA
jgi:aryl-alcohol dehydrogenase-like predicted oxidoreductase